jgi:ATP-dependent protease ClpP protease subunit
MSEIITIDGVVGIDVTPSNVRAQLAAAKGRPISVHISSPGGSAVDGFTIYDLIKAYRGEKETVIFGIAASIASYIALATDKISAHENSIYMVHNAAVFSFPHIQKRQEKAGKKSRK